MAADLDCDEDMFGNACTFNFVCVLCFEKYESKLKPKNFHCGYNVCEVCQKEVQISDESCRECKTVSESDFDLPTCMDSSSIEISSDASSESKTGITGGKNSIEMTSKIEGETLSIEIPINAPSESKKEQISKIRADKWSQYKKKKSSLQISVDSLTGSLRKTVSISIPRNTSSESKTGITGGKNPIEMASKTEGEIPINEPSESKKELLSKEILADKWSESKKEKSDFEIYMDLLAKSMRKTVSISIPRDASTESKTSISRMENPTDTLSDSKIEIKIKETPMSKEIPREILLQKSPENQTHRVSEASNIRETLEDKSNISFENAGHLTESEEEDLAENFYESQLYELEAQSSKIDLKMFYCYNKEIKPNFTLSDFPSNEEFIKEIIFEISNGKDMYAINLERYTSGVYWGKLTCEKERLYIHSFSGRLPKYPPQFVMLRDLKKCMTIENFRTFLDIGNFHLICTMLTSSPETMSFIKLCSGEDGESYIGLDATDNLYENCLSGVLVLKKDLPNIIENTYHFLQSLPSKVTHVFVDDKLVLMKGARCEILRSPNVPHTDIREFFYSAIASVSLFNKEFSCSSLTPEFSVKDCGLIILHPIQENMSAFSA